MSSVIQRIFERKLANPPEFLKTNTHYEVIMGSNAYGVSSDNSDTDIYGFCIPKKETIFPHLAGEILGFGTPQVRFQNWQKHHIDDPEKGVQYDVDIYNIVHYFDLLMDNNPNIIDSLFVPERCVIHCTAIGRMVRDNRKMFLHKGSFHRFRGYGYAQIKKLNDKNPTGKRLELVEKYGFDVKFAYHLCRLIGELEQILTEGDIDLERDRERLKAIRRGEWTKEHLLEWFYAKEKDLEKIYNSEKCILPYKANESNIKQLLINCLEEHYGDLSSAVHIPTKSEDILNDLQHLMDRYRPQQ